LNTPSFTDKQAGRRIGRVKSFILVEPIQNLGIVRQFENLAGDLGTSPGEDSSRIFPEIKEVTAHETSSDTPETPNRGLDLGGRKAGQERPIRK